MRVALICWLLLLAIPARADDKPGERPARSVAEGDAKVVDKPWAVGVTPENQTAALNLYNEGAKTFAEADYKSALETYNKALALWDHPAIRYNIAVCLINLDRPVEAYDNLEKAMRFGDAPLGPDLWKQGHSYEKLLAARVAQIQIDADPGASVSLDGKPVSNEEQRVLTGDHQIVVEKPKFQTETRAIRLNPGDHVTIKIELKPMAVARTLHRRWAKWLPWTVMGVGGAIAVVGVPMLVAASSSYDRYDAAVSAGCVHGCVAGQPDSQHIADLESHAKLQNNLAVSAFVAGSAIAATGFVMVILNQPRLVAPVVGSDHVGVAISGRF